MWILYLHQPKTYYNDSLSYYFNAFKCNFDFDVSVANDVAIDVAKCAFPGKVMQGSPCLEMYALINENGRYMMKLNDKERTNKSLFHIDVL